MKDVLILLLFLGISSFIKKMMKGAKTQERQPVRKKTPERHERIVDTISGLLGAEEPDDSEPSPAAYGEPNAADHSPAHEAAPEVPYAGAPAPLPARPAAYAATRKPGKNTLRRGILLREVLGPCRALRPFGAD